jgi:hypothetical protein
MMGGARVAIQVEDSVMVGKAVPDVFAYVADHAHLLSGPSLSRRRSG